MSNHEKPSPEERLQQWIKPELLAARAYHVPDADGLIKLDAMENPYLLPVELLEEILQVITGAEINRYPDPDASDLKQSMREAMDIPEGMEIMLGNGSDELIQIIALAVAHSGETILAPEPGFVMYKIIADTVGAKYVGVDLNRDDFSLDNEAMLSAIEKHQPAVVFLAYPNNPTGNLFDEESINKIIHAAPGLVVVDEAYSAFSEKSFMQRLGEFDNLVVMRTLSKSGLAGLRLGILTGPALWLNELDKLRLPYNINTLSQKLAELILSRYDILEQQAEIICANRSALFEQLQLIDGVYPWQSSANFILFKSTDKSADEISASLLEQGILIKNVSASFPVLKDCLRVTVGTEDENEAFVAALKLALSS
ncbi:MAG: histidinol-phosphate transaminase [Gammaproteobacteria bacterium]|nr:MAG: histidinol-phosphate transaminase [Gammaproteobacteria bacterium]RKZ69128.1 MAG: histidinol-phosphate transaminase [Gammaproteobacteria bacterium]